MAMGREKVDVSASVSLGRVVLKRANLSDGAMFVGFLVVMAYPLYVARRLLRPSHVVLFLAIAAALSLYKRFVTLRLKSYDLPGDEQRLLQAARQAASALGWRILSAGDHWVVAAAGETELSWGQLVTIITQPNKVYLNSRNRSGSRSKASIAFGRNQKHLSDFLARMQASPLAPPTSAQRELVGRWRLVRSSRDTPRDSEMDIRADGRIFYSVPMGKRRQTVEVFYEIEGNVLVTDVPSAPKKVRNHCFFEEDGSLRLENEEGQAWFQRAM